MSCGDFVVWHVRYEVSCCWLIQWKTCFHKTSSTRGPFTSTTSSRTLHGQMECSLLSRRWHSSNFALIHIKVVSVVNWDVSLLLSLPKLCCNDADVCSRGVMSWEPWCRISTMHALRFMLIKQTKHFFKLRNCAAATQINSLNLWRNCAGRYCHFFTFWSSCTCWKNVPGASDTGQ